MAFGLSRRDGVAARIRMPTVALGLLWLFALSWPT